MAPIATLLPRLSYADAVHGRPAKPSGYSAAPPAPPSVAEWPRPQPNTGNTCHLAVVVQLLGASKGFLQAVLDAAANPAHKECALACLLLECADGKQPLSTLADVLYGHREQESPGLALLLIAERLGFPPSHVTNITRICGECGELRSSECDGHGPLLLALKEERNIETLLKEVMAGVQSQHAACCSWDKDKEVAVEGKQLTTEVVEVAPKEGVLVLQVVRQPGTMNNKDETFAKVEVPQEMGGRQLVGFTVHDTGDDGLSGHWWACVKNSATGEWWLCDDDSVLPVPQMMVLQTAEMGTHFVYEAEERLLPEKMPNKSMKSPAVVPPAGWETPLCFNLGGLLEATGLELDCLDQTCVFDEHQASALQGQEMVSYDDLMQTCQAVAEMAKRRICLAKPHLRQTTEPLVFQPHGAVGLEAAKHSRTVFVEVKEDSSLCCSPAGGLQCDVGGVLVDMDAMLYDELQLDSAGSWRAPAPPTSLRNKQHRRNHRSNQQTKGQIQAALRAERRTAEFENWATSVTQRTPLEREVQHNPRIEHAGVEFIDQEKTSSFLKGTSHKNNMQAHHRNAIQLRRNTITNTDAIPYMTSEDNFVESAGKQIFVKSLGGKTVTMNVELSNTKLTDVLQFVAQRTNIPRDQLYLAFKGRCLAENDNLLDCGVQNNSTITAHMRLLGSAIFFAGGLCLGACQRDSSKQFGDRALKRREIPIVRRRIKRTDNDHHNGPLELDEDNNGNDEEIGPHIDEDDGDGGPLDRVSTDVRKFYKTLRDCGVRMQQHRVSMVNDNSEPINAAQNKAWFLGHIAALFDTFNDPRFPARMFIIYFSGHGNQDGNWVLDTQDANGDWETISIRDITRVYRERIAEQAVRQQCRLLLVSDVCSSGAWLSYVAQRENFYITRGYKIAVQAACRRDESSIDGFFTKTFAEKQRRNARFRWSRSEQHPDFFKAGFPDADRTAKFAAPDVAVGFKLFRRQGHPRFSKSIFERGPELTNQLEAE